MRRLLRAGVLLLLVLFAANFTALEAARSAFHDLFAPYAALLSGQPIDTATTDSCRFLAPPGSATMLGSCQFSEQFGIFQQATLSVRRQVITELTAFNTQVNTLYLGDLIVCWGKPITIVNSEPSGEYMVDLYWSDKRHVQISGAHIGRTPNYFLPVRSITINAMLPACTPS
jgi:hypothetical protein